MDPLEAALASSFTAPDVPPVASHNDVNQQPEVPGEKRGHAATRSVALEAERLAAADESWKREYDERLSHWKAENAARREQSEKTRGEWEHRRSSKDFEGSYVTPSVATSSMASSFVDARDLVSGEGEGGHGKEALDKVLPPSAKAQRQRASTASGSGEDNSQGWENVPSESLISSYPSINFPNVDEKTGRSTGAQQQQDPSKRRGAGDDRRPPTAGFTLPPVAPPSVTLSVFDSTLSTRTRLLALASSLAINLVLPFINGVMLGFGEIAAKSLFAWGGWRDLASGLGLRSAGSRAKSK